MKRDRTGLTLFVLVALVVVCGGSFLAVRTLNNSQAPVSNSNVITTNNVLPALTSDTFSAPQSSITAPTSSEPLVPTAPMATTKVLSDLPSTDEVTTSKEAESTTRNPFTTFANGSVLTTADDSSKNTTTSNPMTSSKSSTTKQEIINTPSTTEAEEVIQQAAVFSDGFLGFLYNPDGNYYYTADDPWQRNFGFNQLYDTGAPFLVFYYDTIRCKFNYDNKDWMIQLWKGQYGFVFIGAEVGVYVKPEDREREHYDCASDDEKLMMSMTFYRKGKELMSREYASYWWCTGFVPGKLDKFSDRSELSMNVRITMKDYKMLLSFCAAMKDNGFELDKDFTTSGLDVYITW